MMKMEMAGESANEIDEMELAEKNKDGSDNGSSRHLRLLQQ